eukprot:TRINITY_DN3439_c0_g1_i4.p4 TRINITY_DN3439_c0_g1~~TRINITY_DN3439_c0_g1_i4.p4  ORF type:complete len:265 (-),score=41.47 TRINITY_DN3439_c0_g1_i4:307-1101(-)
MFKQVVVLLCIVSLGMFQDVPVIPVVDPVEATCRSVTEQGCFCADAWVYAGSTLTNCSNPANVLSADWCALEPGCFAPATGSIESPPATLSVFTAPSATDSEGGEVIEYGFCAPVSCVNDVCLPDIEAATGISTFLTLAQATNAIEFIADNTVLAPTNEALDAALVALGMDINNLTPENLVALSDVLKLHVIKGFLLTTADVGSLAALTEGIPTLSSSLLQVPAEGSSVSVVGGTSSANVIGMVDVDITCNTAVLVIDAVLTAA